MSMPSDSSSAGRQSAAVTSRNMHLATAAQVESAGRGHVQQPPTARTAAGWPVLTGTDPVVAGPPLHRSATPAPASAGPAVELMAAPGGGTRAIAGDRNMILSLSDS